MRRAPLARNQLAFFALWGAILAALVVIGGCGLLPREDDPVLIELPEPPEVNTDTTYPVERIDLYNEVEASAFVTPVQQTSLYFTRSGRLTTLNVKPQQMVQAGEMLAQLDISDLNYQLAQARLDMQITELRNQLSSGQQASGVQLRLRELELQKQQLAVDRIETFIRGATLRAPYSGVIDRVLYQIGDDVSEYDTVMEISNPNDLELQVRLSLDEYEKVFAGHRALIEVSRDDWREGTVIQTVHLNPSDDATISRDIYYARVDLLEPEKADLRMNSRLSARIILDERPGTLAIPLGALREFKNQTYVRVLEGEVRREVYVKTGIRTETMVEILDGLDEGMLVIGR